jgi:hypothetical protein
MGKRFGGRLKSRRRIERQMDQKQDNPFMAALEKFEATEANLVKLERLWEEMEKMIPSGIVFGDSPEHEDRLRAFTSLMDVLPLIDGWKPSAEPPSLHEIAQNRLDAMEVGEFEAQVSVERWIDEPARELREYRHRFNSKRRALIRDMLVELIDTIDADLRTIRAKASDAEPGTELPAEYWTDLKEHVAQIEVLLGSSVERPPRWGDLRRHAHFGYIGDLNDIEKFDWPTIKDALRKGLYGANEPIPVAVDDLADLVQAKPRGAIATKLNWEHLDDETYERLIFALISQEADYENPEWLMQTRAADRGRDLSVYRVSTDSLSGTMRQRVVIQCKHWLSKSVSLPDVSQVNEQMALWSNPRVDILIVATSGRFTADAVTWVEQHNAKGIAPRVEMWPESHLERLLAARPALIAEFGLRSDSLA